MPFTLRPPRPLAKLFSRPPFARPTRAAWAAAQAHHAAENAAANARHAGEEAAAKVQESAQDAVHATAHAAADARDKLRLAARKALGRSGLRKAKKAPPPPKRGLFGAKKPAKPHLAAAALAPVGAIEAFGFFALAAVIMAWPRAGSRFGAPLPPEVEAKAMAAAEPGRGRDARSPLQIPPRGWKDVLLRTWKEFNDDQIAAVAGGVTFFSLLALFPALAAFVSLYGLFADVAKAREQLRLLAGFLPHDVLVFVGDEMLRLAGGEHGSLGFAFVVSLLISLWSANGAVKALFHGLNIAYEEKEERSLVTLNLISLAFTLGAIVFGICAIAAVIVAPAVFSYLGLTAETTWFALLRWPVMFLLLVFGLSLVYRYGPSRQHARWRWLNVGGAAAAVLWVAASLLFSWYVSNFAHYDRTYGSLGAVIGFMFWLWYTTIIVLFGAELNSEMEHQTAVDSTTGTPRPLGARGAKMADEVAPSTAKAR